MLYSCRFLALVIFVIGFASAACSQSKDLPKEFEQLLPRGAIAAITQPEFVSADEADISNNAWVLGVVFEGQAQAYSLTLLNSHEIVNHQIGNTAFAAVW